MHGGVPTSRLVQEFLCFMDRGGPYGQNDMFQPSILGHRLWPPMGLDASMAH